MRHIAVDWSGRATGAEEHIWLAVADGGRLARLENGHTRPQVIEEVIAAAADGPVLVGLDFSFSFPAWFLAQRGWRTAPEAWAAMRDEGEALLATSQAPFWGRSTKAQTLGEPLRRTERQSPGAKSVFQIGGAGAVGTGSVRGMPHLLRLRDAGLAIWPFDAPAPRTVVEIYPRLLTGPVRKSRHRDRLQHLARYAGRQDPVLLERAAGSEDAFDAAVSAIELAARAPTVNALPGDLDDVDRREGRIFGAPAASGG